MNFDVNHYIPSPIFNGFRHLCDKDSSQIGYTFVTNETVSKCRNGIVVMDLMEFVFLFSGIF